MIHVCIDHCPLPSQLMETSSSRFPADYSHLMCGSMLKIVLMSTRDTLVWLSYNNIWTINTYGHFTIPTKRTILLYKCSPYTHIPVYTPRPVSEITGVIISLLCLQGDCTQVSSINDHKDYIMVTKALTVLGFKAAEVKVHTQTEIDTLQGGVESVGRETQTVCNTRQGKEIVLMWEHLEVNVDSLVQTRGQDMWQEIEQLEISLVFTNQIPSYICSCCSVCGVWWLPFYTWETWNSGAMVEHQPASRTRSKPALWPRYVQ